jgi:hypothetical protein
MPILDSLKSAWELASGLGSALGKLSALEAKQAILDLQNLLGKIQGEAFELQQQNNDLRNRIRELEEQAKIRGEVIHEESVCWRRVGDGRDGPYCPVCFDKDAKLIHLNPGATKGVFSCGVCQNRFSTAEYTPDPGFRVSGRHNRGPRGWMAR